MDTSGRGTGERLILIDPLNFPHWSSAVQAVRRTSAGETVVHSTYLMEREPSTDRAVNELELCKRAAV